ncbi:hypothetical protein [Nocardia pseudovaccinii]|uniref:hypothetical protein n=1 Tax=Nocardia pseudovaccinii TaxID=189540 RepID=UPI0007A49A91|nr:hypothetical protein [Nocardia pseudovaccinii]
MDHNPAWPLDPQLRTKISEITGSAELDNLQSLERALQQIFDLPGGSGREELISRASLLFVAALAQPNPVDDTAIRYIVLDWADNGLHPLSMHDANFNVVTNDELALEITFRTVNLRWMDHPSIVADKDGPGTFVLDVYRVLADNDR